VRKVSEHNPGIKAFRVKLELPPLMSKITKISGDNLDTYFHLNPSIYTLRVLRS
jgi:hypothetical protein